MELVADANEVIVSLPFAEGATVKAGDVIVVQDRALSTADLDAARAQLAEAEARVEELKNGPRSTTIRAGIARRDTARVQRDDAVRERDRLLGLVARSLVSQSGSRPAIGSRRCRRVEPCAKRKPTCANCRKARALSRLAQARRGRRQRTRQSAEPGNHLLPARSALADRRDHRLASLSSRRETRARRDGRRVAGQHRAIRARARARTHPREGEDRHGGHAARRRHRAHVQRPGAFHRQRSGVHALLLADRRGSLASLVPCRSGDRRCRRVVAAFRRAGRTSRWRWQSP